MMSDVLGPYWGAGEDWPFNLQGYFLVEILYFLMGLIYYISIPFFLNAQTVYCEIIIFNSIE